MRNINRLRNVVAMIMIAMLIVVIAFLIKLNIKTKSILDDYSFVYSDEKYQTPVKIDNVQVIKQQVSCGYAVIEMFSGWNGGNLTESDLYNEYGKVVTSTGNKFCEEMNKQFPEYKTSIHKYLKNTEFIDLMYKNLSEGKPVPFEWAALFDDEWTLHYSLIIGADIPNDVITVANPYGYYEEISLDELLQRTSFSAYENMPVFLKLGFAVGLFEKNTLFSVEGDLPDRAKIIADADSDNPDTEQVTEQKKQEDEKMRIFTSEEISDEIFNRIYGVSFGTDCTVPREDLRYLQVSYVGFDGESHVGEIICNKAISEDLLDIFEQLYDAKYEIERVELVDNYNGDDEASMEANNSSCFNFRFIAGTTKLSNHAKGMAIDINPLYNPYITSSGFTPINAGDYVDRSTVFAHKIDENDLCYQLFMEHGFSWGGSWTHSKDYQHFEKQ